MCIQDTMALPSNQGRTLGLCPAKAGALIAVCAIKSSTFVLKLRKLRNFLLVLAVPFTPEIHSSGCAWLCLYGFEVSSQSKLGTWWTHRHGGDFHGQILAQHPPLSKRSCKIMACFSHAQNQSKNSCWVLREFPQSLPRAFPRTVAALHLRLKGMKLVLQTYEVLGKSPSKSIRYA